MIPVGTITLCHCRRALEVTGHDRFNRAFWTHMGDLPAMHCPSPLSWNHDLDAHSAEIVRLRREVEKLRGAIETVRLIASTALGQPALRTIDKVLAAIERIEKP